MRCVADQDLDGVEVPSGQERKPRYVRTPVTRSRDLQPLHKLLAESQYGNRTSSRQPRGASSPHADQLGTLRAVVPESRSSRGREWTEPDQTRDGTKPEQCSSVDHVLHWRGFSLRVTIVDLMMSQSGADHDIHFNWATAYVSIVDHVGTQNLNRMSDHKQMHQERCPRKNYSKKRSCCARTASVPARVDLHVESRQAASSPAAHNPHPMHSKHANNPL